MGTKSGWVEKRQHERVIANLKVEYRAIEGGAKKALKHEHYSDTTVERLMSSSQKSAVHQAVTRDISMGGLALVGEQPFTIGSLVEVGLRLPHYKTMLKIIAEVMRSESFTEMQRTYHRSGLKILAINKEDLGHIERFLHIKKLQNELRDDLQKMKK